jgi:hypothetical protein
MTAGRGGPRIDCPIDLFADCEREIERLTAEINHAAAREEKGRLARELLRSVSRLVDCSVYDESNPSCRLCRDFSILRQKTAELINMTTALSR